MLLLELKVRSGAVDGGDDRAREARCKCEGLVV